MQTMSRRSTATNSTTLTSASTSNHIHPNIIDNNNNVHSSRNTLSSPILSKPKIRLSSSNKTKCMQFYNPSKLCLIFYCMWILGVIIFIIIYQYKNNSSSLNPSLKSPLSNSFLQDNPSDNVIGVEKSGNYPIMKGKSPLIKKEQLPDWKHPLQPWEILPRPPKGPSPPMQCDFEGSKTGFLPGCANDNCANHNNLQEAKQKCLKRRIMYWYY